MRGRPTLAGTLDNRVVSVSMTDVVIAKDLLSGATNANMKTIKYTNGLATGNAAPYQNLRNQSYGSLAQHLDLSGPFGFIVFIVFYFMKGKGQKSKMGSVSPIYGQHQK
ncbi:uncharacterized protein LOC128216778 isoform X1 [Mya arenaria]|uniref:uncharacterized protein LOC128216778 isoform X1 n=1 Tax=Mya arenaria TaxID=6604 RepID=UPI0022E5095A|nr:uncharacterized protein LOC128216778 isoform X1 [Mya arenaria]XP_052779403.1 uncharacterized protein LOC128216778 isoform X1 [Mya arenaria]